MPNGHLQFQHTFSLQLPSPVSLQNTCSRNLLKISTQQDKLLLEEDNLLLSYIIEERYFRKVQVQEVMSILLKSYHRKKKVKNNLVLYQINNNHHLPVGVQADPPILQMYFSLLLQSPSSALPLLKIPQFLSFVFIGLPFSHVSPSLDKAEPSIFFQAFSP